jgi:hypothetical protein
MAERTGKRIVESVYGLGTNTLMQLELVKQSRVQGFDVQG